MPFDVGASSGEKYMRVLMLGAPKSGKTYTTLTTCEKPCYVLCSDGRGSMNGVAHLVKGVSADYQPGHDPQEIEKSIHEARAGVKEGRYKTIVWDTLSTYARHVETFYEANSMNARGEPDGRRYWPLYRKHLHSIVDRLFLLKAHVIVLSHFIDLTTPSIEGQAAKSGQGICPLVGGTARQTIPADFTDVVYLEKRAGERTFTLSDDGVFGPGSRSLPGVASCEADIAAMWKLMSPDAGYSKSKILRKV